MGSGYKATPMGIQAIVAKFRDLQRQIDALRRTLTNPLVGNDSLFSPVEPAVANGLTDGLTLTGLTQHDHTEIVAVPAGFTQALVFATATGGNSVTLSNSNLSVAVAINEEIGAVISQNIVGFGSASASLGRTVTGLSGGTVSVTGFVFGENGSAGNGNIRVAAALLFLR